MNDARLSSVFGNVYFEHLSLKKWPDFFNLSIVTHISWVCRCYLLCCLFSRESFIVHVLFLKVSFLSFCPSRRFICVY